MANAEFSILRRHLRRLVEEAPPADIAETAAVMSLASTRLPLPAAQEGAAAAMRHESIPMARVPAAAFQSTSSRARRIAFARDRARAIARTSCAAVGIVGREERRRVEQQLVDAVVGPSLLPRGACGGAGNTKLPNLQVVPALRAAVSRVRRQRPELSAALHNAFNDVMPIHMAAAGAFQHRSAPPLRISLRDATWLDVIVERGRLQRLASRLESKPRT